MTDEKADLSFSRRDLCFVLFRHKAAIVLLFLSALFAIVVGLYLFFPDTYQARARILVKVGRENISLSTVSPVSQRQVVTQLGLRKEDINSEIEILTSRLIIEEVVKKLGTDFLFPEPTKGKTLWKKIKYEAKRIIREVKRFINEILYKINLKKKLPLYDSAVLALQASFSASQVRFSDVIELQFNWFAPDTAEEILDTLVEFYLVHHSEAHRTTGGHDFFQKQVEVLEKRLRDSEDELKFLKEKEEITSYADQSRLLLEKLSGFGASLKTTETELAEANERIRQFKETMASLRARITTGFSTVYKEAERGLLLEEVRAKALEAKKEKLGQHVQSYLDDIQRLRSPDIELKRLDRQIRLSEQSYELYRLKLEEARISDVLDAERIVNVKIIDTPAASPIPVRPKRLLIIGIGVVLSLLVAVAFAFLSEYLDHSIRTAEDVSTYLDLPVLASIREGNK